MCLCVHRVVTETRSEKKMRDGKGQTKKRQSETEREQRRRPRECCIHLLTLLRMDAFLAWQRGERGAGHEEYGGKEMR